MVSCSGAWPVFPHILVTLFSQHWEGLPNSPGDFHAKFVYSERKVYQANMLNVWLGDWIQNISFKPREKKMRLHWFWSYARIFICMMNLLVFETNSNMFSNKKIHKMRNKRNYPIWHSIQPRYSTALSARSHTLPLHHSIIYLRFPIIESINVYIRLAVGIHVASREMRLSERQPLKAYNLMKDECPNFR